MKLQFKKNIEIHAYLLLLIAILSWAINTVLAKGMVMNIKPMNLSFFRWLTALMFILPFGLPGILKEKEVIKNNIFALIALSFFSVAAYNSILYFSATYTTATNMSFVTATAPAFTFLISWILLGEKPGLKKSAGMIISFLGLMIIIFHGKFANLVTFNINPGDCIVVVSVLSWATYSVLLKYFKIQMDSVAFLTILIIFGLPFILPFYLWELSIYGSFVPAPKNLATLLFIGIFPSIVSYICWNAGVKKAGPNIASMFMYLIPVTASLIAWVFLGEHLRIYHVAGGLITFAGFYIVVR